MSGRQRPQGGEPRRARALRQRPLVSLINIKPPQEPASRARAAGSSVSRTPLDASPTATGHVPLDTRNVQVAALGSKGEKTPFPPRNSSKTRTEGAGGAGSALGVATPAPPAPPTGSRRSAAGGPPQPRAGEKTRVAKRSKGFSPAPSHSPGRSVAAGRWLAPSWGAKGPPATSAQPSPRQGRPAVTPDQAGRPLLTRVING